MRSPARHRIVCHASLRVFALWGFLCACAAGQSASSTIRLNAGAIDTSAPAAKARVRTLAQASGMQLHLVQFAGPIRPAWLKDLKASGFSIVNYIPDNAYLVYADAGAIKSWQSTLGTKPQVKWEGPYDSSLKIQPGAVPAAGTKTAASVPTSGLYAIQLVRDNNLNLTTIALIDSVKLAPAARDKVFARFRNIIVRIPVDKVASIAARPDVVSIAPYVIPQKRDERQAVILSGQLTGSGPSAPGYTNWLAGKGFAQAQFTNTNSVVVDVSDSGIDNGTTNVNHFALYRGGTTNGTSRVVYSRLVGTPTGPGSTLAGLDGHGNINAHIIAGMVTNTNTPHVDTNGYRYGLGVAPFVKLGASVVFDPEWTTPDYSSLASLAYADGARVSCNSWGADVGGEYTVDCQEYDYLVRDAQPPWSSVPVPGNQQMSFAFAAGNAGDAPSTVGSPGTAKNVITVGAAENVRSLSTANGGNNAAGEDGSGVTDLGADNANDMIDFSSRGPCLDDRVKPDIVAPGTHITGGVAQNVKTNAAPGKAIAGFDASGISGLFGSGGTNNTNNYFPITPFPNRQQLYSVSSGTSQATPGVTGGAALVYQWFINRGWATAANPVTPAMIKAFIMNAARYMNGTGANDDLYSNNQGMGMMDLGAAFDATTRFLRDQRAEDLFTASGQSRTFVGTINTNTADLRITLAWTDAPGSTTGDAYVNNLDLVVEVNGDTFIGNTFTGAYSSAVDPDAPTDPRDNVESVFIPAGTYPVGTTVTITVNAVNIAGDGVPNNAYEVDQDFALVGYNLDQSLPGQVTGLVGTALSDTSIGLSWSMLTNADAYRIFRSTNNVTNEIALTFDTNFTDTGLTAMTTYEYTVAGTNTAGPGVLSAPTNVTTMSWVAANPYGILVTSPVSKITNSTTNQTYLGQIGTNLVGQQIFWTNVGTGFAGTLSNTSGTNWSQLISLIPGTNRLVFSAGYTVLVGTNDPIAFDSAQGGAYGELNAPGPLAWVNGVSSGNGFGPWTNDVSGSSTLTIVSGSDVSNLNVSGSSLTTATFRGFALIGDGGLARARRTLYVPLEVGQSFVMSFDNNLLAAGRSAGFALADSNGNTRFSFSAQGASPSSFYVITDGAGANSNTGIVYTTNGLVPVTFTLTSSNSYSFVAGTNAPVTNTLAGTGAISTVILSNNLGGAGYENAFYVGNMFVQSYIFANQLTSTNAPPVIRSTATAGIPDTWWYANFGLDTNAWQPALDADGDGQPNGGEYQAGTSPTNASSVFAITSIGMAGTNVSITWSAVANKVYNVQTNTSLGASNWVTVPPSITNTSGTNNLGTNIPVTSPDGFLRVRVAP